MIVMAAENQTGVVINQVATSLTNLQKTISRGLAAAVSIATVGAFRNIQAATFKAAEEVSHLSRTLGIAAEEASALRVAAHDLDLGINGLTNGMSTFAGHLADINKRGNIFDQLGLRLTDIHRQLKPTTQILGEVADKIKAMPDGLAKLSVVRELFGRAGPEWLRFLNQGSEGIKQMGALAERMGLMFTSERLTEIQEYRLALGDLGDSWDGLKVTLGSAMIPVLSRVVDSLTELAQTAIPWMRRAIDAAAPVFHQLWNVVVNIASAIGRFVSGFFAAAFGLRSSAAAAKGLAEGLRWVANLVKHTAEVLARLKMYAYDVGDVLGRVAAVVRNELAIAWDLLYGTLRIVGDLLRGDWRQAWIDLRDTLASLRVHVDGLAQSLQGLSPMTQFLIALAGTAATIRLVTGAVQALTAALGLGGLGGVLGGLLSRFLAVIPGWGWIASAAIAAAATIYANWDAIGPWFAQSWTNLTALATAGAQAIGDFLTQTVPGWINAFTVWLGDTAAAIGDWFGALPETLAFGIGFVAGYLAEAIPAEWTAFKDWTASTWAHLAGWFRGLPGELAGGVQAVGTWLTTTLPQVWDGFKRWTADTLEGLRNWFQALPGRMTEWLENVAKAVEGAYERFKQAGINLGDAVLKGIMKGVGDFWRWISGGVENVAAAFQKGYNAGKSFVTGDGGGSTLASTFNRQPTAEEQRAYEKEVRVRLGGKADEHLKNYPKALGHALGGYFRSPHLAWIAEGGEGETVVPDSRVDEFLPGLLAKSRRGLGTTIINNIYVSGNIARNERELGDIVARALMDRLNLQKQMAY